MRKVFLAAFCLLAGITHLQAQQTYKQKVKGKTNEASLHLSVANSKVEITGYSGKEVEIEARGYEAPEADSRAAGLKPLYNTAEDNTGLGLEVKQEGNVIKVIKASKQEVNYYIKVPQEMNVKLEEVNWNSEEFTIRKVEGEIEVKSNGSDIFLEEVSGPVVASSTSGDITVIFNQLNQDKPTSIAAVSGFIDISLPESTPATLRLSSISGEIYSNVELEYEAEGNVAKDMRRLGGNMIHGNTNGGGVEMTVKAISDNIYLRKK